MNEKRKSKRIMEKPTPNYAESESSYSTNLKAKTALPPDKISSKSVSSKIEDDIEDTVKMTESNIENKESISNIRENMYIVLKELRNLIYPLDIEILSIAHSEHVENLPWSEVLLALKTVFKNINIKVLICKGILKFVPLDKRNEIFEELHCSPIGCHRGVSKTYNRIKQNYYWENLKEDIHRRIQQCLNCQLKKLVRLKTENQW